MERLSSGCAEVVGGERSKAFKNFDRDCFCESDMFNFRIFENLAENEPDQTFDKSVSKLLVDYSFS